MKIVSISTKFPSHHRALSASSRFIVSAWSYPLITWMLGSRRLERGINGNYNFRRVFSLTNSGYIIQRPAQADDAQLIQVWFSSDCYLLLKNWIKLCLISKVHLKVFCCLSVPRTPSGVNWCNELDSAKVKLSLIGFNLNYKCRKFFILSRFCHSSTVIFVFRVSLFSFSTATRRLSCVI